MKNLNGVIEILNRAKEQCWHGVFIKMGGLESNGY